ncbi:hypothetical protein BpHYR1_020618 [Brachionus plicatilis]|uniref:Secreted protein n=1 Tax=Brachionus plicatilis TaxID=10195 RepID=A0A3M7PQP1_BRAPC|nr:hypothetical protein BpHYR1_020618 [Brachionus plicatilis]
MLLIFIQKFMWSLLCNAKVITLAKCYLLEEKKISKSKNLKKFSFKKNFFSSLKNVKIIETSIDFLTMIIILGEFHKN